MKLLVKKALDPTCVHRVWCLCLLKGRGILSWGLCLVCGSVSCDEQHVSGMAICHWLMAEWNLCLCFVPSALSQLLKLTQGPQPAFQACGCTWGLSEAWGHMATIGSSGSSPQRVRICFRKHMEGMTKWLGVKSGKLCQYESSSSAWLKFIRQQPSLHSL